MDPIYPVPSNRIRAAETASAAEHDSGIVVNAGLIAAYDGAAGAAPRVVEIAPAAVGDFIERLASKTYELARSQGGQIPYTAIRELTENFIHAGFAEPVISILNSGSTIRFADQGPGISDKQKVKLPGYTSATRDMKNYIRGVGSGLPIVDDFLRLHGGSLSIEDNVNSGTVITISSRAMTPQAANTNTHIHAQYPESDQSFSTKMVNARQMKALAFLVDSGSAGPTALARELDISIATAHRDLELLESKKMVETLPDKSRCITDLGFSTLNDGLGNV